MTKIFHVVTDVISALFIVLFVYTSFSKALDFSNFVAQLGRSLLSGFPEVAGVLVIGSELAASVLLGVPKWRHAGLYVSSGLMCLFTLYIVATLLISEIIPCSCGGVIANLSWHEHLVFNAVWLLLGGVGIVAGRSGVDAAIN